MVPIFLLVLVLAFLLPEKKLADDNGPGPGVSPGRPERAGPGHAKATAG
ncbi:hypothetical protein [Streptomyces luteogriseus]